MEAEKKQNRQQNIVYWNEGNTARVLQPSYVPEPEQRPVETPGQAPKQKTIRKPKVEQNINLFSLCFLVAAIGVTFYTCSMFLKVQAETVVITKNIRQLEQELDNIQNRNESRFNEILTAVSLDEVYQVAVRDLGMVFPNHNTTYYYQGVEEGYVRQFRKIPEAEKINILKGLFP